MTKKPTKAALLAAKNDERRLKASALEASLGTVEVTDALRRHSHLYGNPEVMALLIDVERGMEETEEAHAEEISAVEEKQYNDGADWGRGEGRKEVIGDHLEPLFGAALLVIENWEQGDLAMAVRELSEAVEDIRRAKVIA